MNPATNHSSTGAIPVTPTEVPWGNFYHLNNLFCECQLAACAIVELSCFAAKYLPNYDVWGHGSNTEGINTATNAFYVIFALICFYVN